MNAVITSTENPAKLPRLHLAIVPNYDCHSCGGCCKKYDVAVTEAERARIASQGWDRDPAMAGVELFHPAEPHLSERFRLNQRPDGSCVFLNERGLCRIHERFGPEAKPLPCRMYPFAFVPAGDHWRIGIRFACPSVAANKGRPAEAHREELEQYLALMIERGEGDPTRYPPPAFKAGRVIDWPELFVLTDTVVSLLRNQGEPLQRRLRKVLAFLRLNEQTDFSSLRGEALRQHLQVLSSTLHELVPDDPGQLAPPSFLGRLLFRQFLAAYLRRDTGSDRGLGKRGFFGRAGSVWRFLRGKGAVPRVHAVLPEITFEQVEQLAGDAAAADEALERYYVTKVGSLQFAGRANFGLSFLDGLRSLLLTFPLIHWVRRALTAAGVEAAVEKAISTIDNPFGYHRLLAGKGQVLCLQILGDQGELDRLIAWYGR